MNTHMILVPLSEETVALGLGKRVSPTESLDDTINRALSREETNSYKNTEGVSVDGAGTQVKNNTKACYFNLFGKRQDASSPTELFVSVLVSLGGRDDSLYDRLSKQIGYGKQRKRRMIAKNQEDLYPQSSVLRVKREIRSLPGDWWVGTSYDTKHKMQFLQKACHAAGMIFGKDLEIDPRLLVGVTLAFTDDEL